ncbi:MAG: 30S ribosome-binding factor RbfA [Bacteroidales bacterium]|nr:30S ribosome-binding factor RbfA [Bacteroidales bacterium]
MENKRIEKVNRLIQKDLAEILREKSRSDFVNAMLSVTKVSVTSDLAFARVYVSIFVAGNKYSDEQILNLLIEKKDYIRMLLAQKERHQLRIIPDLMFFIDDTLEYAKRIDELLKK